MSFEEAMTAFYMALAEERTEQAAQALGRMRAVAASDGGGDGGGGGEEDAALREEMLRACEIKAEHLREAALRQLRQACAAGQDVDSVLNAFSLCAELGGAAEGAGALADCLARVFRTQARASLECVLASKKAAAANEHGYIDRNFYVDGVSDVLTGATDVMNAVADATADQAVLARALAPVHAACADAALEIVRLFAADARMAAWERRATDLARQEPAALRAAEVEPDESLQMVDLFLDELSFVIRVVTSYSAFLRAVCAALDSDDGGGAFRAKAQELSGVYLLLERFYIFQSVRKATAIAEVQELEANVFVSSIVEDVSFVINKAFFRASQVMNYHTALSIVIAIVDALQSMYLPAILELPSRPFVIPIPAEPSISTVSASDADGSRSQDLTAGAGPSTAGAGGVSFSDMLLQAVDEDLTRSVQEEARRIMTINSAYMSGQFVEGFEAKVDELSRASFPGEASIVDCLPTHVDELTESFRSIVDNEVQQVLTSGLRTRLQELLRHHMAETFEYELSAAQYDAFGLRGSPLNKLVEREVMGNARLRRYEATLCRAPFEALVECFVRDLTQWIAGALLDSRKRVNDLGALQLEREATQLLERVSTFVRDSSLRAAFTRLFQVVLILNLMHPAHVLDYLGSVRKELGDDEIAQLLHLRVDFKPDDVRRVVDKLKGTKR